MNLQDALLELREKDHLLGVYKELVGRLKHIQQEGEQIPIHNSTGEFVDEGYIDEVREILEAKIDELVVERKLILKWKVNSAEDDSGGGEA